MKAQLNLPHFWDLSATSTVYHGSSITFCALFVFLSLSTGLSFILNCHDWLDELTPELQQYAAPEISTVSSLAINWYYFIQKQ